MAKMWSRRLACALFSSFLLLPGSSLKGPTTVQATEGMKAYRINDLPGEVYRIYGRSNHLPRGWTLEHPGSGLAFSAHCEGDVVLRLFIRYLSPPYHLYFTVFVDGKRVGDARGQSVETKAQQEGENIVELKLARDLPPGDHLIEIYRQSEAGYGYVTLDSLALRGRLQPLPKRPLPVLEIIGDSITAGYGLYPPVAGIDVQDNYYEDATRSYAFLTARALHSDFSILALSGYGLVSGWGEGHNMMKVFPFTNWSRDASVSGLYGFNRAADLVLVNLGTNDWNTLVESKQPLPPDQPSFYEGVRQFTHSIREKYPTASIVWVYGMMLPDNEYNRQIQQVLQEMGGEAERLYALALPSGRSGILGHPDQEEQEKAAEVLLPALERILQENQVDFDSATTETTSLDSPSSSPPSSPVVNASPSEGQETEPTGEGGVFSFSSKTLFAAGATLLVCLVLALCFLLWKKPH